MESKGSVSNTLSWVRSSEEDFALELVLQLHRLDLPELVAVYAEAAGVKVAGVARRGG